MNEWSEVTTADVMQEFNEREITLINSVRGASVATGTAGDSLTGILERTVSRVRGAVFAGGTELGDAGTIPDSLKGDAIAIARWRFLVSIAQLKPLQTADRKEECERAEKRLERVESGDLKIQGPSGAGAGTSLAGPSFGGWVKGDRGGEFSRNNQEGL